MKKKKKLELNPYRIDRFDSIPICIRVNVVKWWCYAACYYLVGFGMPQLMYSVIDTMFTLGLVMGLVSALVIAFIVRGICVKEEVYNKYLAIKNNGPIRIIQHVLYSWILVTMVTMTYQIINTAIIAVMNLETGVITLAVEPIIFGVFVVIYDILFIKVIDRLKGTKV